MSNYTGTKRINVTEIPYLEMYLNPFSPIEAEHERRVKRQRTTQNRLEAAELKLKLARTKAQALNAQPNKTKELV